MAQEFFINSEALERKVRQVFPSQGGKGAGFDLSASTQVVPIVDLTETAEGSVLRTDLQTAVSTAVSSAVADNTTATKRSKIKDFTRMNIRTEIEINKIYKNALFKSSCLVSPLGRFTII